ncbi:MAG: globin domain-containing protein [Alphaproteobacteria bacterium]
MTPRQIALVRETFATIRPAAGAAAMMFYDRLFVVDPSLRHLFRRPQTEQAEALAGMLAVAVDGLDEIGRLLPALHDLGRRHAAWGVRDEDYGTVAAALIWTLEHGLGTAFTAEAKTAWVAVYGALADAMKAGAYESGAAARQAA